VSDASVIAICHAARVRAAASTKPIADYSSWQHDSDAGESASTSSGSVSTSEQSSSEDSSDDIEEICCPVPPPPVRSEIGDARMRAKLSPLLAKTLRHSATSWGLQLGPDGYALVSEVLSLKPFWECGFTPRDVEHVVHWERQESRKQRFSIRQGHNGFEIRANQGHSDNAVNEQLVAEPIPRDELPSQLVHGTFLENMAQIFKEGLRPMDRHHIHLFVKDCGVGRRNAEVLIYVDVEKALAAGIRFSHAENRVVLSTGGPGEAIPSTCFAKVVHASNGMLLTPENAGLIKPRYVPPHQRAEALKAVKAGNKDHKSSVRPSRV